MTTGFATGSRWGIKGAEDLGNGLKVGFILESGFNSDDGKMAQDGRLFGRESSLSLEGGFGKVTFGRFGSLMSDAGSTGLLGATSVMGNAYGINTMKGNTGAAFARIDNGINYVTPNFAGFRAHAQYSFKMDNVLGGGDEGKASADRYAALGLTYANGPFNAVLVGDWTNYGSAAGDFDDGYNILVGGNYDFGVAKVFAKFTYFDNMKGILDSFKVENAFITSGAQFEGYGVELGTNIPALGGNILAAVGYLDAENVDNSDDSYARYNVGVGYTYAFSKRTNVYAIVNYAQEKSDLNDTTAKAYQAGCGLVHKF